MSLSLRDPHGESSGVQRERGMESEPLTGAKESREPLGQEQRQTESERWLGRRRLERKLHDGASLRISALALRVGLLRHQGSPAEFEQWRSGIGEIQDELHAVLQELREIASNIYPPLLDQAGLGPALRELADQTGADLRVSIGRDRFGPVAEGAAYFAVAEWLEGCPEVEQPVHIAVSRDQDDLVVTVWPLETCHLMYLSAHARPLGGTVYPTPPEAGGPQTGAMTMRIPCE